MHSQKICNWTKITVEQWMALVLACITSVKVITLSGFCLHNTHTNFGVGRAGGIWLWWMTTGLLKHLHGSCLPLHPIRHIRLSFSRKGNGYSPWTAQCGNRCLAQGHFNNEWSWMSTGFKPATFRLHLQLNQEHKRVGMWKKVITSLSSIHLPWSCQVAMA